MANKSESYLNPNPNSSSQSPSKVQASDDPVPDVDPNSYMLEKFKLYETRARFYLVGSDKNKKYFRVLKIDRSEPSELNISEDPVVYSQLEVKSLLQRIAEGNRSIGGLNFHAKVYGIAGCIKFLEPYYLILVTKRRQIGCICGHAIYAIDESQIIPIPHASVLTDVANSKTEQRYKRLLSSVDLTKDFFYSYTYPVMLSLQKNVQFMDTVGIQYDSRFVWNSYLTGDVRTRCKSNIWTVALVHGHFKQMRMSVFGRDCCVTLISRRSRHFAGTRYLKRGVNDKGRVANDVETEQIVLDEDAGSCKGKMTSVVQMRGSIPLFWSQEASRFSPKPDIILQIYDPTYEATRLHFEDLAERYGNPIIVLNLIKTFEKRPREMMLRREFASAVKYLNKILSEEKHLKFIHWDFHKFSKTKTANVLGVLSVVASAALDMTGFYYSGKPPVVKRRSTQKNRNYTVRKESYYDIEPHFQNGVLRTNCIDCLDRTNVAQYAYGLEALGRQLQALGISDEPKVDPDSSFAIALMDMYQGMGDALAHQYGGSAAHNTVFPDKLGKWKATTQSREFLNSIKRYYNNAYTDGEKQDAINLFLGYFKPQEGKAALWELDSDYYLHVSGVGDYSILDKCGSSSGDAIAQGVRASLESVPACREDFFRIKLTSFDKLIEKTCSLIKGVRLYRQPGQELTGSGGSSEVAPDAIEIQLKSPNWLFGQRKDEQSTTSSRAATDVNTDSASQVDDDKINSLDLRWVSPIDDFNKEDNFQRYLAMTCVNECNGWYGGSLLGDLEETSDIYRHYVQLCEASSMEPFENDMQREEHYAVVVQQNMIENVDGVAVLSEMETASKEYDKVSSDLGIFPMCRLSAGDPSLLTRWIVGEEKI